MPHCPVSPLPFSDCNYNIDIITRKFMFFSFSFSFKKQNWYYTSPEFLCSLQLITYRNTNYQLSILLLQLVAARQREPLWVLYVLSPDILCFFSIFYLYTESVYFILLCNISNKTLPYHTSACTNNLYIYIYIISSITKLCAVKYVSLFVQNLDYKHQPMCCLDEASACF